MLLFDMAGSCSTRAQAEHTEMTVSEILGETPRGLLEPANQMGEDEN